MPNNFSAFFETLVAGADEYNKAKVGQTAILDCVYKDVKPEAARIGKTIDVYFPDFGPLSNIGNGILSGQTVSPNYIPLVFQNRAGAALQFQDFEQWQTAVDLAQKFFDPLYKRAREFLNGQFAALITTSNFNANAPITGAIQGEVGVADQLNAWGVLADQKVPLEDSDKLHLLVHNRVYQKMLGDAGWVQESLVAAAIAAEARTKASLQNAFNFRPVWDQQMPTASGSILYGQVTLTSASATITGLNTNFTTAGSGGVFAARHVSGLRQRHHQDPVQGDGGRERYQSDLEQRHPDHPGRLGLRHDHGPVHHDPGPHLHDHDRQHVGHDHQRRPDQREHRPVAVLRDRHQRRDRHQPVPDHQRRDDHRHAGHPDPGG